MNQQKGFSLIEVLVSLFLLTTIAFATLQQQWETRILVHQLEVRTQSLHVQDDQNETRYVFHLPALDRKEQ